MATRTISANLTSPKSATLYDGDYIYYQTNPIDSGAASGTMNGAYLTLTDIKVLSSSCYISVYVGGQKVGQTVEMNRYNYGNQQTWSGNIEMTNLQNAIMTASGAIELHCYDTASPTAKVYSTLSSGSCTITVDYSGGSDAYVTQPSPPTVTQNSDGTMTFKWDPVYAVGVSGTIEYTLGVFWESDGQWYQSIDWITETTATIPIPAEAYGQTVLFTLAARCTEDYMSYCTFNVTATGSPPSDIYLGPVNPPRISHTSTSILTVSWDPVEAYGGSGSVEYMLYECFLDTNTGTYTYEKVFTDWTTSTSASVSITTSMRNANHIYSLVAWYTNDNYVSNSNFVGFYIGRSGTSSSGQITACTFGENARCWLDSPYSTSATTLRWEGAVSGERNTVAGYIVWRGATTDQYSYPAEESWQYLGHTAETSMQVDPPPEGTYYLYSVCVVGEVFYDISNTSSWRDCETLHYYGNIIPPSSLRIIQNDDGTFDMDWDPGYINGEVATEYYLWGYRGDTGEYGHVSTFYGDDRPRSIPIKDSSQGYDYYDLEIYYSVFIANDVGTGWVDCTLHAPTLSDPSNIRMSANEGETVTISWDPSVLSYTSPADGQAIQYGIFSLNSENMLGVCTETQYTLDKSITSTFEGDPEELYIAAYVPTKNPDYPDLYTDYVYVGPFTYKESLSTYIGAPGKPSYTQNPDGTITFEWEPSESNGIDAVYYTIMGYYEPNDEVWVLVPNSEYTTETKITTYIDMWYYSQTDVDIYIYARDSTGEYYSWSNIERLSLVDNAVLGEPGELRITQNPEGTVTFSWDHVNASGLSDAVRHYMVYYGEYTEENYASGAFGEVIRDELGQPKWITDNSLTIDIPIQSYGVTQQFALAVSYGYKYYFSEYYWFTSETPSLSAPSNVKLSTPAGESTTLSWDPAVFTATDGTITYIVYKNGQQIATTQDTQYPFASSVTSKWGTSAVNLSVSATANTVHKLDEFKTLTSGTSESVQFTYSKKYPTFTAYPTLSLASASGSEISVTWTQAVLENRNGASIVYQVSIGPDSYNDDYLVLNADENTLSTTISEKTIVSTLGDGIGASEQGATFFVCVRAYWITQDGTSGGWGQNSGLEFTYFPTLNPPANVKLSRQSGVETTVSWENSPVGNNDIAQAILIVGGNELQAIEDYSSGLDIVKSVWRNYQPGEYAISIAHEYYGRYAVSESVIFKYESGLVKYFGNGSPERCEVYVWDESKNKYVLCIPHYYDNGSWKACGC